MKKVLMTIASIAALMGCAGPRTVDELKADTSSVTKTLKVNREYQDAYRFILTNSRRCFNVARMLHVTGDLYTDIQSGDVLIGMTTAGNDVRVAVNVKPAQTSGDSDITITTTQREQVVGTTVENWLTGKSTACHL